MAIRCADIPRLPGLENIRLRAGLQGSNRVIRWPYIAENDALAPWVSGGELIFVTGINQPRSERNLQQLIQEGVEYQAAGLVILTGSDFIRRIPGSVIDLANSLAFPLFEQPYALKMVVVTETISNAIVQDNLLGQSVKLFLTRLINGFADTPELIHLRASELGLSVSKPYVVFALRLAEFQQRLQSDDPDEQRRLIQQRNRIEQWLGELLKRRGIEWPILEHEQDLLAIWPAGDEHAPALAEALEQALDFLQRQQPEFTLYAGVSDPQSGLAGLASAVDQARQAAQFALQHQHKRLFLYEQLGIARLFAAIPQRSLLAQFCQQHLGALCFARDSASLELKDTLTQYLNHFGNRQQASAALGIHRNTLSYRLKRIEQITCHPLGDPYSRLNLQNALLIEQMLFQHHTIETSTNR